MQQQTDFQPVETVETVRAVSEAVAGADLGLAYELAQSGLLRGLIHPTLFNARALWLERQNRDDEALADFERALSLAPRNAVQLNAIGICLTRLYRLEEAVAVFDEAIRLNPTFTPSYHRKGIALGMMGETDAAKRANEQAVRLDPRDAAALGSLASLAARKGDTTKALGFAGRALKIDPREPTAAAAHALIDNAEGRYVQAEHRMLPLLESSELVSHPRAVAFGILADSLDGQGRTGEAFAAYGRENEELRRIHAPRFSRLRSITDTTRELVSHFAAVQTDGWQDRSGEPQNRELPRQHVFVLGFYRSGTTLLRQVLAVHPDVVALEEKDFLLDAATHYLFEPAGLASLVALSEEALAVERDAYWRKIKESGVTVAGKVFVDKHPLNTVKLPLIAKLFPGAKIIFAARDPRDVVLSCYRRHFEVNAAMFELLTIESAAAFYDIVMQFAELMRPFFADPFFVHRYEDMVADFDGRIGALCDYLDLPFRPAMREFYAHASAQDVRSPSASQVRRELYREGLAQWRRYQTQLSPVFPLLRPWVEKFGYPAD